MSRSTVRQLPPRDDPHTSMTFIMYHGAVLIQIAEDERFTAMFPKAAKG
jgi:hypothetical protein